MTLREFLQHKKVSKDLAKLLGETLPLGVVRVRQLIEKGITALAETYNASDEKQLKLDVASNEILAEVMKNSGLVSSMASEELDGLVETGFQGPFTVVFDPLDGSSLVDVNFAVGSIFGIHQAGNPVGKTGDEQLAAAIVVYGPRTTLILCPGLHLGVHEFFMNADGQFMLVKENIRIKEDSKYFAPGNLRATKDRKDYLKLCNFWTENGYTLRYSGGMVPDLNHIFLKGNGIFSYPAYSEAPQGKLRLLYECAPMAFLMEEAGGAASDGHVRILEKPITELHQRSPIFIGSKNEVARCEKALE